MTSHSFSEQISDGTHESIWEDSVVSSLCYHRRLTSIPGDPCLQGLPVEAHQTQISDMLRNRVVVAWGNWIAAIEIPCQWAWTISVVSKVKCIL